MGIIQFQFLLVRLKVKLKKSWLQKIIQFQFLLVRLKANNALPLHRTIKFQFLLVRLKEALAITVFAIVKNFNSYWYD